MNKINEHRFADLYKISSGISSTPEQAGHGFPFASFSTVFNNYFLPENLPDLMDTSEQERITYSIKKGDVLLTRTSETFDELAMSCVALKDYPNATFSGFVKRLRPKAEAEGVVDAKYLGFYLRGYLFRKTITNHSILTLRASFNGDIFSFLRLFLPEYSQQVKIGDFLYLLERKISLNNAINSELESTVRTLYDYWFTQFDFPDANGKPYKSSGGAMVWSEELKREIPKGWKAARLPKNDLCRLISSGIDEFDGEKIYLSTSEVNGMEITDHTITVDYETRPSRANMQPTMNSVWFAKMKDTLKHLLVSDGADVLVSNYLLSTGFGGLQCTEDSVYYIWNYLNADYFENKKNQIATGATQQAINDTDLNEFFIIVPASDVLKKFTSAVLPYYRLICRNRFQSKDLTELRDFLLPLLMNGQVRVASADEAVKHAVETKPQPAVVKEPSKREAIFKRLVLSAYILDNICDEPTAGRVKLEKLLYLSEHCAQLPLYSEFKRAAAGPYDSKSLHSIESQLSKNKWFKRQKVSGESRAYTRLAKSNGYRQYINTNFSNEQKRVIDRLIAMFKASRTIQCEIVATLYGAWNDFLLEGVQPTDDQIVNEVLTNWHKKKERIGRGRWLKALQWMRSEKIIPVGYGVSMKGDPNA